MAANVIRALTFGFILSAAWATGSYYQVARSDIPQEKSVAQLTFAMAEQLVRAASGGQYHVVRLFKGPHGLYGVVVQAEDTPSSTSVMWVTPDGAAVMAGTLLDASGADLNQAALVTLGFRLRAAESLRQASAAKAEAMVAGSGGPILTAFIDPNCSYCHLLYQEVMPYVLKKKIRVRFVMVGVVKADSKDRAAAILSAPNPLAALNQDQEHFDLTAEEGGFPINTNKHSVDAAASVAANNILMSKSGVDGTPAFLYCSKAKPGVQLVIGLPQDLEQFLGDLAIGPAPECTSGIS